MRSIHVLLLLAVSWSCSTEELNTTLVGTWQLVSYCKPTSNTTCTSVTVPADKNVFVTFTNGGQFIETYINTKPIEYGFLGCNGSYQMEGSAVRIMTLCMASPTGKVISFVLGQPDQLVLNSAETGRYVFVKSR